MPRKVATVAAIVSLLPSVALAQGAGAAVPAQDVQDDATRPAGASPAPPPQTGATPGALAPWGAAGAPDEPGAEPRAPEPPPGRRLGRPSRAEREFAWRYPEFRESEFWITGIFGAMTLGGLVIPTDTPRWTSTNGFDSGVRDALRFESRDGRKTADDISDVGLVTSLNWLAFDAGVVAWWARDKQSVAYQMALIDIETLAITAGVTSLVKGIVARQRPYGPECSDPIVARTDDCEMDALNRSFFSGHASTSFAAAGLTCMHHAHLPLYKDAVGDAAACVGAMAVAGTTGVLRVVSDNHHTTDVLLGAAVGTAFGLGVPYFLHYAHEIPDDAAAAGPTSPSPSPRSPGVSFRLVPGPTSATVVGAF